MRGRLARIQDVAVERPALRHATEQLFTRDFLQRVLASVADSYRERLLRVEVVAIALLQFVVAGMPSFLSLVDSLRDGRLPGLRAVEVSAAAFYKRLHAISHTVFLEMLRATTSRLASVRKHRRKWMSSLAPFAKGIYAIDDTTLDALMRRTQALKKYRKGETGTLGGRLGCAVDLETGSFAEVLYDPDSAANEKTHIRPLVERLPVGALYVFDLGYFAFPLFDYLTDRLCYFVTRLREKVSYKEIRTLAEGAHYRDRLVFLGKHRADRAGHPVRLVELLIEGKWYRYITNVLDPKDLSADKLWALYGQRWSIEMSFAAVKRALGMAFLHACHQNGMLIQVWCTLAVYQVLQDLRLEIASANGWNEDSVSWTNLMRRISWYAEERDGPSLRKWLVGKADRLYLCKRGVRKRRATELPPLVLGEIAQVSPVDLQELPARTARQGKPYKRKKPAAPLIIGGLS